MIDKSLPAYLQQVLELQVVESKLTQDEELQGIMDRLTNLNEKVELLKAKIKINREKSSVNRINQK